jgi:steroid delta-isomerase-like uncharacterized protein
MSTISAVATREARLKLVEDHCLAENQHDLNAIMETFGAQPYFGLNDLEINGRETVQGLYAGFGFGEQGCFSDLHVEVLRRHVGDEAITLEILITGKHTTEWNGIPATGKAISVPACAIFTFDEAGKLAGEKVYADFSIVLKQLGVLSN